MSFCIKIPLNGTGRRIVIGDVHGCRKTLVHLIENDIGLKKEDQLFLLGDYIDRGPDSRGVLDYIIELKKKGFQVFPLRGNHEEDLLKYNQEEFRYMQWHLEKNNNLDLLAGEKLAEKYLQFLEGLPYCFELENHFIVHAGFDLSKPDPFMDKEGMLVQRGMVYNEELLHGKTVIHGHQPFYIETITRMIEKREKIIPLDNGVPYVKKHKIYDHTQLGHLCALDLDSFHLVRTPNLDMV